MGTYKHVTDKKGTRFPLFWKTKF